MLQVTDEIVETFQREGVVVLRGLFEPWVDALRLGVDRVMREPSALERSYRPKDGSAAFFQDYCNWARIAEFRTFVFESPAASIAARLMRSREARFFHDHVLVKRPGSGSVTPWHHDAPYYCVDGTQTVSFWVPLDPVPREISLECIAGSQRWSGQGFRPTRFDGTPLYPDDGFDEMPDIDAERGRLTIRGWSMQPGDAVAFDFHTVHGAPANRTEHMRRVFSARWVGEDAHFVRRAGPTSPPFPDLRLADGDALEGADFPLVYRA